MQVDDKPHHPPKPSRRLIRLVRQVLVEGIKQGQHDDDFDVAEEMQEPMGLW